MNLPSVERLREWIARKRTAYRITFCGGQARPSPYGLEVLQDLKRYCGADREGLVVSPVTRMADPVATAYRAGRRDVYLRIMKYLELEEVPDDARPQPQSEP